MEFEWDENKRLRNLEKHGFDFLRAKELLSGPHVICPSRYTGEEVRQLAIGEIEGRYAAVVFTTREGRYRIISMRSARHEERQKYKDLYS